MDHLDFILAKTAFLEMRFLPLQASCSKLSVNLVVMEERGERRGDREQLELGYLTVEEDAKLAHCLS